MSAPRPVKVKRHRRRSGSYGTQRGMLGSALGGAVYGFVEKSFPDLPTVPLVGRAGTVALICYFLSKGGHGGGLIRDLGMSASAIAGYQLGSTGKINGEDLSGIAAQL